jgi:hypothetical protein
MLDAMKEYSTQLEGELKVNPSVGNMELECRTIDSSRRCAVARARGQRERRARAENVVAN